MYGGFCTDVGAVVQRGLKKSGACSDLDSRKMIAQELTHRLCLGKWGKGVPAMCVEGTSCTQPMNCRGCPGGKGSPPVPGACL